MSSYRYSSSEQRPNSYHYSLQHLLSLLQQKGTALLFPDEDGDNPLHSIVRLARPEKEKEDLLVTLLTHSFVDINSHGKGGMTALHYAVQVGVVGVWFSCCQW